MPVLKKQLEIIPLEENIFSFIYFHLNWRMGVDNDLEGLEMFKISVNWGAGTNKLKWVGKI